MTVYTVHLRRPGPDEELIFVREGFCFWAFALSWLWALGHRLWWFAGALFVANMIVAAVGVVLDLHPVGQGALGFTVSAIAGAVAFDARRWALARDGFEEMGVVVADGIDGASQRFLDDHPVLSEQMA